MNATSSFTKFRLLLRFWWSWRKTSISLGQLMHLTGIYLMLDRDDDEILKILLKGLQSHAAGGPISDDQLAYDLHALGWRTKEEYLPIRRLLYLGEWVSVVSEELWSKVRIIQKNYAWDEYYDWATNEDGDIEYDA